MPTTEHTINDALAALLRETRHAWRDTSVVSSENSGLLKGSQGQPDILVAEAQVSPVAVETELPPAMTLEAEAISRLGVRLRTTGRAILSCLAIRLPDRLRTRQGTHLRREIGEARDLGFALFTGSSSSAYSRWPRSGWLVGDVRDLSVLIQSASVPPEVIDEAADQLVGGVSEAAALLGELAAANPGAIERICQSLRQEESEQTHRMAATILANAFVFQETLAGGPGQLSEVNSLEQLRSLRGGTSKAAVIAEWRKILAVNYWPIFDIARRILEVIPAGPSKPIIEGLMTTATGLLEHQVMRSHDLTGAVFQRLIADRKFLAAYYTTPASAALLAGLAITSDSPLNVEAWDDAGKVKALRIADFACGTGTLLSAAYHRIGQLHELAGGDAAALHPDMMARSLVGCDVLPAATHLTASMLAGTHPTVKYSQGSILTLKYGKQPNGSIALGSLDLLDPQGVFEVLSITAKAAGAMGETEEQTWRSLPRASFDVVLMNPPFTRPTAHEGGKDVLNPMFGAFGSSDEEQREMAAATKRLTHGTSAHGNAGEASIFLVLADRKLRPSGTLALVMPLSLMAGEAWEESRALIAGNYSDVMLLSIAATEGGALSFSADTGMGECLVVGRKSSEGSKRATFCILEEPPRLALLGASTARELGRIRGQGRLQRIEDGPFGGTPIRLGGEVIGYAIDAPLPRSGGWHLSRIADLSLAQAAHQLEQASRVWLPGMGEELATPIPTARVSTIAEVGPCHRDINGKTTSGDPRGPFDISEISPTRAPTYPTLWGHDASRERTMAFNPDCEATMRLGAAGRVREAIKQNAARVWASASHCHFNLDFRFNSQSTAMQYTLGRAIGGRAWVSISLPTPEHEKALVLWGNTSLGMLLHWWFASKQQDGRGSIVRSRLADLPVLDVTSLEAERLKAAVRIFDQMSGLDFLPLNEIDHDPIRAELDGRVCLDVLDLPAALLQPEGPLALLRAKLSREPSIHGGKRGRLGAAQEPRP